MFFELGYEKTLQPKIHSKLLKDEMNSLHNRLALLIKAFLELYCSSISYKAAIITPNAIRIDLDRNEVGPVSIEERYYTKLKQVRIVWALEGDGYEAGWE